jgi:hypothetical protein
MIWCLEFDAVPTLMLLLSRSSVKGDPNECWWIPTATTLSTIASVYPPMPTD